MSEERPQGLAKIETFFETWIFRSRWFLAPIYVGLVLALALLVIKFAQELLFLIPNVFSMSDKELILALLTLVDLSLVGNLMLMVVFSGYENFVSKIDVAQHRDRPEWMGKVDYSGLKIKLIGSMVAISGIELLKGFVKSKELTGGAPWWEGPVGIQIVIHLTFVLSGVLLALMDLLTERSHLIAKQAHASEHHEKGSSEEG